MWDFAAEVGRGGVCFVGLAVIISATSPVCGGFVEISGAAGPKLLRLGEGAGEVGRLSCLEGEGELVDVGGAVLPWCML